MDLNVLDLKKGKEGGRNQSKGISGSYVSHLGRIGLCSNGRLYRQALSFWDNFYDSIGSHISNASSPCSLTWRCQLDVWPLFFWIRSVYLYPLKTLPPPTSCFLLQLFCSCWIPPSVGAQYSCILFAHHTVEGIGWSTAIHSGEAQLCWQDDGFLLGQSLCNPNEGSGQCQS